MNIYWHWNPFSYTPSFVLCVCLYCCHSSFVRLACYRGYKGHTQKSPWRENLSYFLLFSSKRLYRSIMCTLIRFLKFYKMQIAANMRNPDNRSPLSCPPLFMLAGSPPCSLLLPLLPAPPLPPAGQRSVELPLFQLLQTLQDKGRFLSCIILTRWCERSGW